MIDKIFSRTIGMMTLAACMFNVAPAMADNGDWTIYASYHNPTKAVKVGTSHYVLANGNLYVYDSEDGSLGAFDKTNALSDFGIYDIAYSKATNSLFILYKNGNIDVMRIGRGCINMPDLKNKSLSDKTLKEVNITGNKAYISIGSGIVVVNLSDTYFENFYNLNKTVTKTLVSDTKIYATTSNGIYVGKLSDNLLDASNWKLTTTEELNKDGEYASLKNENTADAEALATVSSITPNSPIRNYSYKLAMYGDRMLVSGGNFDYENVDYKGTAMQYENGKWTNFDETASIKLSSASSYINLTDLVQDPNDDTHHWASTVSSGIYEFKNYVCVNRYSHNNSPLKSILPENTFADMLYTRVTGLQYDSKGNLWMCNNQVDSVVCVMKKDGTWKKYYFNEIEGFPTFDNIMFDSQGWAWINSRRTTTSGHVAGILVFENNGTIDDTDDDKHKFISTFSNQDGTSYTPNLYYCTKEDLDGAVWIGTESGLFVTYSPDKVFDSDFTLSQVKVARNDGSGLADYLLSGVPVKCIAIDGGNRKWIGTLGNGVFLVSADGTETIEHFTTENSPLISDGINNIAINGKTGEVFFATKSGLCSFVGDATDAASDMDDNSLKVYPNPVRPEYSGDIHITGLMYNSNVKIVNAAGKLVNEGTSIGGEYSWNGCYNNGKRCNSGIYYVLGTDEDGKKGATTKILIVK